MKGLLQVVGFLTILPVRTWPSLKPGDLGSSAGWFPIVGAGLGGILLLGRWLLNLLFPPFLSGAMLMAGWVILTGGLHLDGLADCCDGLAAATDGKRRLEIMRDHRLGAFGTIGLALDLLLKAALIAALPRGLGLLLAPVAGRWMILLLATRQQARSEGMGIGFQAGLTPGGLAIAGSVTAAVAAMLGWRGLVAYLSAHAAGLVLFYWAKARIGGVTGDVLGAGCELAELAAMIPFAAGSM